ncbi:MAG: cytochrome c nitrite reductase small subunit [Phycisphaerae bacterium]|nr:cytochrome c nitrite reductase small subunit [Phycisphaerae bacterium]
MADAVGKPTGRWRAAAVLGALFGSLLAAAGYTSHYSKATAYLSDDPTACINCHIMNDQYRAWASGPHHASATCNDCHVPHDSILHKYMVKAEHGYRHSKGFTLQDFHEPIRMQASSRQVVNDNCVRCHADVTHGIRPDAGSYAARTGGTERPARLNDLECIHCHASVAHGARR